jgi:hypothetical protein
MAIARQIARETTLRPIVCDWDHRTVPRVLEIPPNCLVELLCVWLMARFRFDYRDSLAFGRHCLSAQQTARLERR